MRPKSILIWADSAKCKQCGKNFSRKGKNMNFLKLQLKSKPSDKNAELLLLETDNQQKLQQMTPSPECSKQLSITDALKNRGAWDNNNSKQIEIDQLLAEMIALQKLPFNFVLKCTIK